MKKFILIFLFLISNSIFSQERRIDLPYKMIYEAMIDQQKNSKIKLNIEKQYSNSGNLIIIEEMESSITYYYFNNKGFCNSIQVYTSLSSAMFYIAYLEKKYLSSGNNKWSFTRNGSKYYISFDYEDFNGKKQPVFVIKKNR